MAETAGRPPLIASGHGHIVVEGPIGVGKTTLARKLAEFYGASLVLEQPEENPFLERFYQMPRQFALPTQLYFLFQRSRLLAPLHQRDLFHGVTVSDFLFQKDSLFAGLTLDEPEFALYEQVYQQVAKEQTAPDLVIYLQAPVEVLIERVRGRGRGFERHLEADYLERVADAYTTFFHHYTASPLLIINASGMNFVDQPADFEALVDHLRQIRSGRHYFNPLPLDWP